MHPVLLAFYFFAFLSLVVSKPYDISLSAGADFCSSCKCGDLAECRTQCDKCLGAPGKDHTLCDYCKYPGCKDNCLCWSYCARTGLGCPLRRGNCDTECGGYCKMHCGGIRTFSRFATCGGTYERQQDPIDLGFYRPESIELEATIPTENVIASGDDTIKEDIGIFGNEGRTDSVW